MLDTNEIQLIKRLKSKPRLGMADDYLDKIQDQLKGIFDGYKAASGDICKIKCIRNKKFSCTIWI